MYLTVIWIQPSADWPGVGDLGAIVLNLTKVCGAFIIIGPGLELCTIRKYSEIISTARCSIHPR